MSEGNKIKIRMMPSLSNYRKKWLATNRCWISDEKCCVCSSPIKINECWRQTELSRRHSVLQKICFQIYYILNHIFLTILHMGLFSLMFFPFPSSNLSICSRLKTGNSVSQYELKILKYDDITALKIKYFIFLYKKERNKRKKHVQ